MPFNHAQNGGQNPNQKDLLLSENGEARSGQSQKKYLKTKIFFGLLLFVGVFALIFFTLNFVSNVKIHSGAVERQAENEEKQKEAWQELVAMQSRDTDGDGLTDYDEEYVYGTSAYLADTDSDGYDDKLEIETDNDPLCPAGRDCEIVTEEREDVVDFPELTEPGDDIQNITDYTPDEIRQMLIEDGVSVEQVNSLTDSDIEQILNELQTEDMTDQNNGMPSAETPKEIPEDLSVEEIRQMMLETGSITNEQLDMLTDDELLDLYKEVYQEIKTNE
jgi:hypothetical protein